MNAALKSAPAAAEPDPVFALIEAHRTAYAVWSPLATAWSETIGGSPEWDAAEAAQDEPGTRETQAFEALLKSRPTTAAGLWALTAYLPEAVRKVGLSTDSTEQAALDALREGALQLGLAATSEAPLAGVNQRGTDPAPAAYAASRQAEAEMAAFQSEPGGVSTDALWEHEQSLTSLQVDAREQAWRTPPTTRAGRRALIDYARFQVGLFTGPSGRVDDPEHLLKVILDAFAAAIEAEGSEPAHPDTALLALGMPFLTAWRDEGAADPVPDGERSEAQARCSALADRIAALPATTPEGLGIKALAFACYSGGIGSPAGPMPEPRDSSTASDDGLLWQIQTGAARVLAGDAGTSVETPANAAAAPVEQAAGPAATTLDLSACSLSQLARLYEALRGVYEHLGAAGQRPCFRVDGHLLTRAGEILDEELDRIGAMLSDCADAVIARIPSSSDEREEALFVRVSHEMVANGCISDRALMRDLVRSWGENGRLATEAGR